MTKLLNKIIAIMVITIILTSIGMLVENKYLQNDQVMSYPKVGYKVRIAQTPNDTYFEDQYYLQQIKAEGIFETDTTSANEIIIAILDTGIDLTHPDLKDNIVEGINLLNKDEPPQDDNGHGTNLAGIIAAISNNGIGISGMANNTKIMPIKVLDHKGEGDPFFVGLGIRYAVDNGAKVILLSLGESSYTPLMKEAVDYAESKGVLVIAASGNEGNRLNYPSAFSNVISVGAVDSTDNYANYSNYGQQLDVVAPGEGIFTTKLGGGYTSNSGTSMAAPQVAGLAALILQKYPELTPREVADIIRFSADDVEEPGWDIKTGYGRINVNKALSMPLDTLIDGYEPNQTIQTAHIFPLGDRFNAQLTEEDIDWYYFQLPYDGKFRISLGLDQLLEYGVLLEIIPSDQVVPEVTEQQNEQEQELDLEEAPTQPEQEESSQDEDGINSESDQEQTSQNEEEQTFQSGEEQTEENTSSEQDNTDKMVYQIRGEQTLDFDLPKGDYYIKIQFAPEQLQTEVKSIKYTISNQFKIYDDPFEENDKPWEAYVIDNINTPITGTLNEDYDQDWFKIHLNKKGTLSVTVSVDTLRLDPVLFLQPVGGIGQEFDYQGSGREEFGYINITPGDYYIRITDYNNYAVNGEYYLELGFKTEDGDTNEPNDISSMAKLLDLTDQRIKGVISDNSDYDWYTFKIEEPTFTTINFEANEDIEAAILNSDLEVIWLNETKKWERNNMMEKGTYYLRFYSTKSNVKYNFEVIQIELDGNFYDIHSHWAKDSIVKLYEEKIIEGYQDFTFRPNQPITRGEVALAISKVLQLPDGNQSPFTDVNKESELYPVLAKLYQAKIMMGYADNTFRPDQPIRRDELVIILSRAFNLPVILDIEPLFKDVNVGDFGYNEINTFKRFGWINGYEDGTFRAKRDTSRAEFVVLLDRVRNIEPIELRESSEQLTEQVNQPQ
ncbi:hypothetical protein BHF71_01170 [Vulcanibacillus modesticaldus]|uniref:SLH domain-containing protein n=1 Tax=Vulcanibacillus modesticaldus TaxID=337097 RepID=A0A1D2YW04_9BACI|nr:S8 family serine peptidase [Vulcanibacillus modesticaldus]OEF99816.1 hypothetical protein BHF71_01170 [Vulcanibacillus modesticaldus]